MSNVLIRKVLEDALAAMPGVPEFARAGKTYEPKTDVPYAALHMIWNKPDGSTLGPGFRRDSGALQITLNFPDGEGSVPVETMAEKIRSRFRRGTTFDPGFRVLVNDHPYTNQPQPDGGWMRMAVRVPFIADVFGAV